MDFCLIDRSPGTANLVAMMDTKQRGAKEKAEERKNLKPRLVADPSMAVNQLTSTLFNFLARNRTGNLWCLISAPASLPSPTCYQPRMAGQALPAGV